jgi:formylglycine-generating enzyme required for sulfatase activity
MMNLKKVANSITLSVIALLAIFIASCKYETSTSTGWNYNDTKNGGFEKAPFVEQETGPGLILVEGGSFTMGRVEQDLNYDWNNVPRTVTVSSFYIDETEVTNHHWCEYLYWIGRVYGADYPEVYKKALPDTLVWRSKLAYNEPYVDYYLRHPAFRDYPVVGVNWLQANDYCAWRSDRVNEMILIREGLFEPFPQQVNEDHFSTEAYLAGQYESGKRVDGVTDYSPTGETRNLRMEDGILLPRYRLPTEAEWEFAAYGLIGNSFQELVTERKIYPWSGHFVRNPNINSKAYGDFNANFVRGKGDYMGVAGSLNDNADITAPVYSFQPNDYGLYNMGGNVSEWVMDVYRPLSPDDEDEFRPFRGNVFQTKVLNSEGVTDDKLDKVTYDVEGIKEYLEKFTKITQGQLTPEETQLVETLVQYANEASEFTKSRKEDAGFQRIQDGVDLIKSTDLAISGKLIKGVSDYIVNTPGNLKYRNVTPEENIDRKNYRDADNIDVLDGDLQSSIYYEDPTKEGNVMYDYGSTSLVNDKAHVYKGGSWRDRAYYLNPGTRRFMDERKATPTIGFRCAMDRVGSPRGLGE